MIDSTKSLIYQGIGIAETKLKVFGQRLAEVGKINTNVLCLSADLTSQTEADIFRSAIPDRFFSMGMAEQNMIGVAAGLARAGEIPFAHSFACFISRRCFDQITMSVAYPKLNVKLVAMMPGISSPGGASHQAIDDLAMLRATPNMTILDLGEATEVEQAVKLAVETDGPVYLRLRRGLLPHMFDTSKYKLEIKQSYWIRKGTDVGFITSGLMTERAIQAAAILEANGISTSVLHIPSIKPIDEEGIIHIASTCKVLISLDNHSIIGGLGSAVAEVISENRISVNFKRIGLRDVYGKAASNAYLYRFFGLDPDQIATQAYRQLEGNMEVTLTSGWVSDSNKESGWGEDWKQK